MAKDIISIEDLRYSYTGDVEVLNIESLSIEMGEKTCLIGPNGSGKSTLIKILMGILPDYWGRVYVFETPPERLPTSLMKRIGYVPESNILPGSMLVRDYLDIFAVERGSGYEEVASRIGLDLVLDKRLGSLSSGFKRRVMIAASLIGSPDLIIMDEPFVNVDIESRIYIEEALAEYTVDSTLLLSSHILPYRLRLRGMLLYQGRVIGEVEDIGGGLKAVLRCGDDEVVSRDPEEVLRLLDEGCRLVSVECESIYDIFKRFFMGRT